MHIIVTEVLHWAAAAPLLYLLLFRRSAGRPYRYVAAGFAVSWLADLGASMLGGSQALTFVYPALQFGLFADGFGASWITWPLLAITAAVVLGTPLAEPEVWVTLTGSMAVLYLSAGKPLGPSMIVFCGIATVIYVLGIVPNAQNQEGFMPWWYGYQGSRLLAFGLFILTAHREARRA